MEQLTTLRFTLANLPCYVNMAKQNLKLLAFSRGTTPNRNAIRTRREYTLMLKIPNAQQVETNRNQINGAVALY